MKHKYVRLKDYNVFIFFPEIIEHSTFRHLNPVSAGFCYFDSEKEKVNCFGKSISLGIDSKPDDTDFATKQFYGIDAYLKLWQ